MQQHEVGRRDYRVIETTCRPVVVPRAIMR